MDQVAGVRRVVEETGVPGVLALGAPRATAEVSIETAAGLCDGVQKELGNAMVLVQRELAEAEAGCIDSAATARVLRKLARIHRTMHFQLYAQRLELDAAERRLRGEVVHEHAAE